MTPFCFHGFKRSSSVSCGLANDILGFKWSIRNWIFIQMFIWISARLCGGFFTRGRWVLWPWAPSAYFSGFFILISQQLGEDPAERLQEDSGKVGDLAAILQVTDLATERAEIGEDGCEQRPTSRLVGLGSKIASKGTFSFCRRRGIAWNNERPLWF